MKTSRFILSTLIALSMAGSIATGGEPPYSDSFDSPKHESRRATRGPWKFESGTATCKQDDALYAQFKNHGPVVWYDLDFKNAAIGFSMKPDADVKTFVFTINGADGHVFRFVTGTKGTLIKAFAHEGEPDGSLDRNGPPLNAGQWTPVSVTFKDETAVVKIGEYEKTVTHPAIAQDKTTIGLGFSFGTLSLKEVSVK